MQSQVDENDGLRELETADAPMVGERRRLVAIGEMAYRLSMGALTAHDIANGGVHRAPSGGGR